MANLTIVLDDDVLKKARLRAIEKGTSVNRIVREYLEAYARVRPERETAIADLLRLSAAAGSRRGRRRWTRDELHER
jgi:plasmid stability protein